MRRRRTTKRRTRRRRAMKRIMMRRRTTRWQEGGRKEGGWKEGGWWEGGRREGQREGEWEGQREGVWHEGWRWEGQLNSYFYWCIFSIKIAYTASTLIYVIRKVCIKNSRNCDCKKCEFLTHCKIWPNPYKKWIKKICKIYLFSLVYNNIIEECFLTILRKKVWMFYHIWMKIIN